MAAVGNGTAGVTATPLEMARVMAVIAGGGRQVNPHMKAKKALSMKRWPLMIPR
ncbi:penicillin-binding transpeptidase domain-containing protein [Streptomyces sp. N2A]|uniref:penicillin-binding transpeptidase domain-containing protein n=1 Tax=Streptomyces sp. N2A TaxID=3073936 RepID=UPI0037DA678B